MKLGNSSKNANRNGPITTSRLVVDSDIRQRFTTTNEDIN